MKSPRFAFMHHDGGRRMAFPHHLHEQKAGKPPHSDATSAEDALKRQSEDALALCALHSLPPLPLHYEVFFAYVTGDPAAVRQEIDTVLQKGRPLTDKLLGDIHQRHFRTDSSAAAEAEARAQGELERAVAYLRNAEQDTSRFGSALMTYGEGLAGATDADGSRNYVERLLAETRAMQEKSRELEKQLKKSSAEIDRLKSNLEKARLEAVTDELTGVGNRKLFDQTLLGSVERAQASRRPLSLIFCDVDHFKTFNDSWGHKLGDHVLKLVAQVLRSLVGDKGVPARYGGEEFAIILPDISLPEATAMAERIRLAISRKIMKSRSTGQTLGRITMSFGVSQYRNGEDLDGFVGRADRALYEAKDSGRNRVMCEPVAF